MDMLCCLLRNVAIYLLQTQAHLPMSATKTSMTDVCGGWGREELLSSVWHYHSPACLLTSSSSSSSFISSMMVARPFHTSAFARWLRRERTSPASESPASLGA